MENRFESRVSPSMLDVGTFQRMTSEKTTYQSDSYFEKLKVYIKSAQVAMGVISFFIFMILLINWVTDE